MPNMSYLPVNNPAQNSPPPWLRRGVSVTNHITAQSYADQLYKTDFNTERIYKISISHTFMKLRGVFKYYFYIRYVYKNTYTNVAPSGK